MIAMTRELLIGAAIFFVPIGKYVGGARATGTFTAAAVIAADETIVIGAVTYTFKAVIGATANQVKVGANQAETLDNLIAAINGTAGGGAIYGSATVAHPLVTAAAGAGDTMVVTAKVAGTQGNLIATTETAAGVGNQWGAATLTGGVTGDAVAIDAKPADPADWADWKFGCVSLVKMDQTKKTETRECAKDTGGYAEHLREWITRDAFNFTTLSYNQLFHQLAFGVPSFESGQSVKPFTTTFRQLDGWLRIEAKNEDGVPLATLELYGRLRLGEVPEWKNESGSPTWNFEYLGSGEYDLDTLTPA